MIQVTLTVLKSITLIRSAMSLMLFNVTYSQVPEIRARTPLGEPLFCLPRELSNAFKDTN